MPENTARQHHRPLAAAFTIVVGLALAACSSGTAMSDATETTAELAPASIALQLRFTPSVQFAGSYLAQEDGFYDEQALEVTVSPGGASIAVEPLLVQGTADIGMSSPGTTAQAVAEGADLTIVAAGYQSSAGAIVSLADNPIETPDDLIGKRIGVVSSNTSVAQFLAVNGIDESEVEIVPIQGDASPLISGQVDGMYGLITNQVIALEQEGYDPVALRFSDYGMDSLDLTYTVATAALDDAERRDAIIRFLMAEIQGWEAAVSDPAAAADFVVNGPAADLGLDLAQQTAQAEAQVVLVQPDADTQIMSMSDERIDATLTTLDAQAIRAEASLFDTSLIDEAYERLGR